MVRVVVGATVLLRPAGPTAYQALILAGIGPRFEHVADLEAALTAQALNVYQQVLDSKISQMPDFHIGTPTLVSGLQLLPRDAARCRNDFPRLGMAIP